MKDSPRKVRVIEDGSVERWSGTKAEQVAGSTDVVSFSVAVGGSVQAIRPDGTLAPSWPVAPSWLVNVIDVVLHSSRNAPGDVMALVGEPGAIAAQTWPVAKPAVTAEGFSARVPTINGRVYRLEYSESLLNADWKPLNLVAGTGKPLTLTDRAPLSKQRYYRVRSW